MSLWAAGLVPLAVWCSAPLAGLPGATETATAATSSASAELREIERALARDLGGGSPPAPADVAPPGAGLQSLLPDLALVADFALAVFSDREHLQTGGHDPSENGFNLQQLELSISGKVDPYFRFDSHIVLGLFGVEVEEAYATTLELPVGLQVRAGQLLTRFGRINPTHPHAWDLVDQPFALGRVFGGEGNRGLGLEVSWLAPLAWYVEFVASGTMAAGEATSRSFFGANDLGVESPLDLENLLAVKQFFPLSDAWSLLAGISAATGPSSTGRDNRADVFGVDLYLKYRPLVGPEGTVVSLQTEWIYRQRQVPGDRLRDLSGYAQLFYRFAPRWGAALRFELGTPAIGEDGEPAADPLDPDWSALRHRTSAALTFWPTEFSRLRVQASLDVPKWRDEPVYAAFLAAEVGVGAHGAHSF